MDARARLSCLLSLLALACPSTSGTEAEDSTSDSETSGSEPVPGCECVADQEFDDDNLDPMLPTCGGELLCDVVMASFEPEPFVVANPEALDCALAALRDRTPGLLRFSYEQNTGQFSDDGYVLILDDGRAVRRGWGWQDLSYEIDDASLGPLEAATVFEDCLAAEPLDAFGCLREPLAGHDAICDEGYLYSSI